MITKKELIELLIKITQRQEKALENEDIDKFISLLEDRQELLDKMEVLHQEYPETREQHEEELVKELQALDQKNQEEFKRQFEEVKENLRKVRQMKKSEQQYNNPYDTSWEEGMFFDKKEGR